ncbi:unnamed protein product [Linum trigynum]|uniref:Protein kinase domain-containing protein n=2 Tax=Linum trigynum TaxID=586398 RepID=A0AAV2D1H0_9ROSI
MVKLKLEIIIKFMSSLLFSLFFLLSSLPFSAVSQLSPAQTTAVIDIAGKLTNNSAAVPWSPSSQPNPCSWRGVLCSADNSSITALSLSGFGLSTSDFLLDVCKIESLLSLDVSNNHLSSIPDAFIAGCSGMDGLKFLNFSRNQLVGSLPVLKGFVGLETLDLSFNSLSGNVSFQLDELQSLKSLNLSWNEFTGSVPGRIGNSTGLEELVLSVNKFSGGIPREIGDYRNLSLIDLSVNHLSGSVPTDIGSLTRLKVLILSANQLSEAIPPSISNIPALERFAANQNQFDGSIPMGLTNFLRLLDLSYNNLTGPIPDDLLAQPRLTSVDLSYNSLNGAIPANLSSSLFRLRLGSNALNGNIPASFASLQSLTYLELDNNSLSNVVPGELGSCRKLALLNLADNELTGFLPESVGNLVNLQVLKLQINHLTGPIPEEITQLLNLSILNISWNSLNGSIPHSVSNLQKLTHLTLQGNDLSGSIPVTISQMNSLIELQLGQNQLTGIIPPMPVKLQIALNLSSNHLDGHIPNSLAQLRDLEVLDLSNNQLSGEIPDSLVRLSSLIQLSLSNNNLSGAVPPFRSFVALNTTGNDELVFPPTKQTPPPPQKRKRSVAIGVILAAVSAVLAVAVVAISVLLFSRRVLKVNNDQQSEPGENDHFVGPPQHVIHGNLLTSSGIHRSSIDFFKAMDVVADPANIMLRTRFCTYYKAIMPSGAIYLVKKLNLSEKIFQMNGHDKFTEELEVLGRLSNSNVMTPLAYVLTEDSAYLFYENFNQGCLFDLLHKVGKEKMVVDWPSRYSIAVGVAQGLASLHGCSMGPILLLDLSSRNVLLKSMKEPVVGDIELCKVIDPSKSTGSLSMVAGSVGYIPPEYAYTMRVTMAGNVYSFGVILLELVTGKPAVSDGIELAKWAASNSKNQDRWDGIIEGSISRGSLSVRSQMLSVLKVALSCVSALPEARPKMKSVLRMILNAR